jgi:hypothetical protein
MSKKDEPKATQTVDFYICDTCPNQPICKEGRACRYYRGWIGGHKPDINVSEYMRHPDRIPGLTKSEQKHARKMFIPKESILEEIFAEAD